MLSTIACRCISSYTGADSCQKGQTFHRSLGTMLLQLDYQKMSRSHHNYLPVLTMLVAVALMLVPSQVENQVVSRVLFFLDNELC